MTAKVELLTPSGGKVILDPTDTAVDRVLTLPAVAGTVFNQGNVVGTVSQSGGVPTGAIIESGFNANGNFVKYADGTMILTGGFSASIAISTQFLGGFRSTGTVTITLPVAFVNLDYAIVFRGSNFEPSLSIIENPQDRTASSVSPIFTAVTSQTAFNRALRFIAIGRWA